MSPSPTSPPRHAGRCRRDRGQRRHGKGLDARCRRPRRHHHRRQRHRRAFRRARYRHQQCRHLACASRSTTTVMRRRGPRACRHADRASAHHPRRAAVSAQIEMPADRQYRLHRGARRHRTAQPLFRGQGRRRRPDAFARGRTRPRRHHRELHLPGPDPHRPSPSGFRRSTRRSTPNAAPHSAATAIPRKSRT